MKPRLAVPALIAAALLGAPAVAPGVQDDKKPQAAAPATAPAAVPGTEEERALDAEPFPGEPSKQPTAAEWAAAPRVRLTRQGPQAAGCRAYRLREWLRFRCPDLTISAISLLGGKTEGVAFWITPSKGGSEMTRGGEVLLPLRRGDRRVIQILTFGPGYDGPFTLLPAIVVQEQWLEGDAAPTVTAM